MEITCHNFESNLESIRESINLADFIAFDTEFSGKSSFN
jgi:CAF1 family ribonuclease